MSDLSLPREHYVKAWMNPPEHRVSSDTSTREAFALMKGEHIRHLLVVDGDELLGVVTDRDLRRPRAPDGEIMSIQDLYALGDDAQVRDVMTTELVTCEPDELIANAARLMVENKISCLPVLREEELLGILTSDDLLAALVYAVDPDYLEAREIEG